MAEKKINGRIVHKHDTQANWEKATNFCPKQGEIIIYDIDSSYSYERIKIGDGATFVNDLPFVNDIITNVEIDEICGSSISSGQEVEL